MTPRAGRRSRARGSRRLSTRVVAAERRGGTVTLVESEEGRGARFDVRLPQAVRVPATAAEVAR